MDGKLYAFNTATPPARPPLFSGTWHGTYESPLSSGKVRAVSVQKGSQVSFAWFLEKAGRGEAQGTVQENRLEVSLRINTPRCQGGLKSDGRLEKGELRAEVRIERCMGNVVTGRLALRGQ
jgi:hypothetical protein